MPDRWALELAEALRGDIRDADSGGDGLMFANIKTELPITLLAHDQEITKHLYINASLAVRAGDQVLVLKSGASFYILLKVVPV